MEQETAAHLESLALAALSNVALDLAPLYDLECFQQVLTKQKIEPAWLQRLASGLCRSLMIAYLLYKVIVTCTCRWSVAVLLAEQLRWHCT